MIVKNIMSTDVLTVKESTSLFEVATLLIQKKIAGMPVVDDMNKPVGSISEKDLLNYFYPQETEKYNWFNLSKLMLDPDTNLKEVKVSPIMSKSPATVTPETTLFDAGTLISNRSLRQIAVVDDNGKLVGVVSEGDVCRALLDEKIKEIS